MSIYHGVTEIPMIEIENKLLWTWLSRKLKENNEMKTDGGFIVSLDSLKHDYAVLFNTYIQFEYEEDQYVLNELVLLLDSLLYIIDQNIRSHNTICFIVSY